MQNNEQDLKLFAIEVEIVAEIANTSEGREKERMTSLVMLNTLPRQHK